MKGIPFFAERFWLRVTKTRGCWFWLASTDGDGYGQVCRDGRLRKSHRVAWEMARGPIPAGALVLHKCDTPACVRLSHLFLGTPSDNRRDCVAKGRTNLPCGNQHWCAKLTATKALRIRHLEKAGWTLRALALKFAVSVRTVQKIVDGETWVVRNAAVRAGSAASAKAASLDRLRRKR